MCERKSTIKPKTNTPAIIVRLHIKKGYLSYNFLLSLIEIDLSDIVATAFKRKNNNPISTIPNSETEIIIR